MTLTPRFARCTTARASVAISPALRRISSLSPGCGLAGPNADEDWRTEISAASGATPTTPSGLPGGGPGTGGTSPPPGPAAGATGSSGGGAVRLGGGGGGGGAVTVTVLGFGGAGGGVVGKRRRRDFGRGWRRADTRRHRRRLRGRVGRLRRDDRGDDGAVRIAVEQAAVLVAHHVVAAGEQRGESRVRGDAGVDESDRHPRAGGVLPRLGDVQHDVARRGLGDVRGRHGQRVGTGVLLLHLLVGTGRIVRRQRGGVDAGRLDGHCRRGHHHVGAKQHGSHCRRRRGPRPAGQSIHQ